MSSVLPSGILICCTGPFGSGSLCLFGFCLPSLRCLISALTQAGGGDLLFRFASSVQSCCGEGGALQTDIAVCGEHSPCSNPAQGCLCFPVYTAQAPGCSMWSEPCVECGSSFRVLHKSADSVAPAFCAFLGLSSSGSQGLGRPLPSAAPASISAANWLLVGCQQLVFVLRRCCGSRPSRISGSLWIETGGLFAVWEGMPSLGLSLPLSPPPCLLPPAGMGRSAPG